MCVALDTQDLNIASYANIHTGSYLEVGMVYIMGQKQQRNGSNGDKGSGY